MIRQQPNRSNTYRLKAEAKIETGWPGGLSGAIGDYLCGKATLAMISEQTGAIFRSLRRVFKHRGVTLRSRGDALRVDYALHPEREQKTAAKLRKSTSFFRPDVMAKATAARLETIRLDPSRHGNAHQKMSIWESKFAGFLDAEGIAYKFNQPAAGFWLDFYLPDQALGFEIGRSGEHFSQARHETIVSALSLGNIIYVAKATMKNAPVSYTQNLIALIKSGRIDPSALGEHRMVRRKSRKDAGIAMHVEGYQFVRSSVFV